MITQLNYKDMLDSLPVPVGLSAIPRDLLCLNKGSIPMYGKDATVKNDIINESEIPEGISEKLINNFAGFFFMFDRETKLEGIKKKGA